MEGVRGGKRERETVKERRREEDRRTEGGTSKGEGAREIVREEGDSRKGK